LKNYKLVLPENLNHFQYLFGGYLLKWVDEMAWIAATLEFPNCRFVTIGMDRVEFRKSVKTGTILEFEMTRTRVGRTSVSYLVEVTRANGDSEDSAAEQSTEMANVAQESIFSTTVTMVNVNLDGQKVPIA
jgi:acyl-CoA hydrolase